jgi:hypothetical protein
LYWAVDDRGDSEVDGDIGLWAVYKTPANITAAALDDLPGYTNHTVHCRLFSATYSLNVSYIDNIPNIQTTVIPLEQMTPEFLTGVNLSSQAPNELLPLNLFSIHEAVMDILLGYIQLSTVQTEPSNFEGTSVTLVHDAIFYTTPDHFTFPVFNSGFGELLQNLLENVTVSMIAGGNATGVSNESTLATTITYFTLYDYEAERLWQAYGAALGVSMILGIVGGYMLSKNRFSSEVSFVQTLLATRNPTLDELCEGARFGHKLPEQIANAHLKFGRVNGSDKLCFGLESEIGEVSQ